jgi:two-component system, NarL family, response regulator NreC
MELAVWDLGIELMSITILLADDHKIVRDGLRALIAREDDMEVVAEAADGREAVDMACELKPDVVIMDVGMPELNGIEATREIIQALPGTKVLGLSMHSNKWFTARMFGAGAAGYVQKDCAFDELVKAIRAVQEGQVYISPNLSKY